MEIGFKTLTGIVLTVAVLSVAITKYYWPSVQVQTKTETVEKEVVRTDVVTVTKEVSKPDGTKEVVTTVTDKSVKKSDTKSDAVVVQFHKPDYLVTGGIVSNFKEKPEYMLGVSKRVLGPIYLGATYQTNNTYGLNVTIEF